ncbi:MAG: hypothetical protein ACTSX7_16750 [Alphaproteobacteria bacterium]
MWLIVSMVVGAILVVVGLVGSYYRLLAFLLVVVVLGGLALAMLGGPVG